MKSFMLKKWYKNKKNLEEKKKNHINNQSFENNNDEIIYQQIQNVILTKKYKKRWIILFSFIFLSIMNNLMQYSFSSISDITIIYYSITSTQLDMLALVFMISGSTIRFISMWIIDTKGLGIGVYIYIYI